MAEIDFIVQGELYRAAFEKGPDAVVVVDGAGTIILMNEQAELLTGRSRKDLIGQRVETIIPVDLREAHIGHRGAFMRTPYRRNMGTGLDVFVLQRREPDEVPLSVKVNLAPVPSTIGTVVIATVRQTEVSTWGSG